ncbi:hypothetical protein chiPu_0018677 [Chiloscyllium punctatum]|uniref:Uncharacterized protein n=1 Tax=Chiloscyllium punctatum TaxID=137246 RepID=A0A401RP90_CHIPU|nr:hypothetical protein [Chiloscyllium punctatum]
MNPAPLLCFVNTDRETRTKAPAAARGGMRPRRRDSRYRRRRRRRHLGEGHGPVGRMRGRRSSWRQFGAGRMRRLMDRFGREEKVEPRDIIVSSGCNGCCCSNILQAHEMGKDCRLDTRSKHRERRLTTLVRPPLWVPHLRKFAEVDLQSANSIQTSFLVLTE